MPQTVLLNLFPANVMITGTMTRSVRVAVADVDGARKAFVYDLVNGQPALYAATGVQSFDKPQRRRRGLDPDYTVTTTDGEVWEIRKAGGCGCGSKLRSFNPFGGANRVGT